MNIIPTVVSHFDHYSVDSVITKSLNKLDGSKLIFDYSYLFTSSVVSFRLNCESMAI